MEKANRWLQKPGTNQDTLTFIDLSWNYIGDAEAQSLAMDLEKNTTLTSILLYFNNIGDVGAQSLATALEKNTTLTYISLVSNKIGDIGAQSLATALEKNTTLTSISLGSNNIGDIGAQSLAKALEKNTTLILVNLHCNRMKANLRKTVESFCIRNQVTHKSEIREKMFRKCNMNALNSFFVLRPPNTGFTNFVRCCRHSLYEASRITGSEIITRILLYLCQIPPHFTDIPQKSLNWRSIQSIIYLMETLVEITKHHLLHKRVLARSERYNSQSLYHSELATTALVDVVGKAVSRLCYEAEYDKENEKNTKRKRVTESL